MLWKNLVIGLAAALLFSLGASQAQAEEGDCTQLLKTVCNDCHNSDRVCEKIGGTEKKWKALLSWMVANGAELEKEERTLLVNCMTEPFDEAKNFCKK